MRIRTILLTLVALAVLAVPAFAQTNLPTLRLPLGNTPDQLANAYPALQCQNMQMGKLCSLATATFRGLNIKVEFLFEPAADPKLIGVLFKSADETCDPARFLTPFKAGLDDLTDRAGELKDPDTGRSVFIYGSNQLVGGVDGKRCEALLFARSSSIYTMLQGFVEQVFKDMPGQTGEENSAKQAAREVVKRVWGIE